MPLFIYQTIVILQVRSLADTSSALPHGCRFARIRPVKGRACPSERNECLMSKYDPSTPRKGMNRWPRSRSNRLRPCCGRYVLVLLLGAGASAQPVIAQDRSAGRLVVEGADTAMIGDFTAGQSQTVQFRLRNSGIQPVAIKAISKSCDCADAEMSTNLVAAGETVEITLRTLAGRLVGPFSKSVYVITTSADPDPQSRAVQLTFVGRGIEAADGADTKPASAASPASTVANGPAAMADGALPARPEQETIVPILSTNALVRVEFYVQEGCAECLLLRREFLPAITARYGSSLSPVVSDTHDRATFLRLLDTLEACGVTANEPLYMVVDGRSVLSGWREIERHGFGLIDKTLSGSRIVTEGAVVAGESAAARLFRRFSWTAVAAAGLADGLNPCAFTTIVFLTSLLAAGGRRGGAIMLGGLSFCLASFATYLLIGLGLLSALRRLEGLAYVHAVVEWGTIAALVGLGMLSFLDAWRYARSGDTRTVWLQLPDGVKKRIRLFALARWGGPAVFVTGLFCGAGVTVFESVCTGQMYLPTLVFMSREGGGHRAWCLLLLYNILFITPLFMVFFLGSLGVRSQRLVRWTHRNVVPAKILLAAVFLVLAVLLLARIGNGGRSSWRRSQEASTSPPAFGGPGSVPSWPHETGLSQQNRQQRFLTTYYGMALYGKGTEASLCVRLS